MASLVTRKSGLRFVQFVNAAGERRTVTLGKTAPREADRVRDKIEQLATARRHGLEPSSDVQQWLAKIGDDLHAKLVSVGLAEPREKPKSVTLGELAETYMASRSDWKPRTKINFEQGMRWLSKHFGPSADIKSITEAEAEAFRRWLEPRLSVATVNRVVKRCKQLFSHAVRSRLLDRSPFAYVRGGVVGGTSHDRRHFVTREEIAAVLEACPDHEWRLLVALSRFGGLRIPSEAIELKWSDINWERNRIVVPVPKLEHLPGHETRVVPIFSELRSYLETAFAEAPEGAVYVISQHRGDNLRTQLARIIHKAGLKQWPKVWHAMRASRQTELTASFPLHVVCAWIGNSPSVAQEHYLTVTEQDFTKAVTVDETTASDWHQKRHQLGAELARNDSQHKQATPPFSEENEGLRVGADCPMPPQGLEP